MLRRTAAIGVGLVALVLVSDARVALAADPAELLAQRYAPVVRLVAQTEPCGHGEPFEPTDVDVVLGNDEVALRGPWDKTNIVAVGPTADDLASGRYGYHLDLPGNALSPGCSYEQWARRVTAGSQPRTYARVVTEAARPGRLALQYWFFYVFNDFNDKHEGDWEMIQLDFDAGTPAEALRRTPAEVGYSQHEGAERARWGDGKLRLVDGTHPVVYPALGSHANYFDSKLFLGRSAAQGVGCDDTVGPSRDVRPLVSLVPGGDAAAVRAFPWLGYVGRWGEEHRGFYDGPTGPNTKEQWTAPITWADSSWRSRSYTVPAGGSIGPSATGFFCGSVAWGSSVLTSLVGDPTPLVIGFAAALLIVVWLASRTRWDLSSPFRAARRRPWGSLVATAFRLYRGEPLLFVGIGVLFVPLGAVITGVQYLLFRHGTFSPLVASAGASNAAVGTLAFALGFLFTVFGLTVVQAATAVAVAELDSGRPVRARDAYRLAFPRIRPALGALVVAAAIVALLDLTAFGLVLGTWLVIRWSLLAQVAVLERSPSRGLLRRSARLVRGHWWRVASITVFVTGVGLLLGPLLGTLVLFATSASFDFVNLVSGLVYAITLPFVAITTTYLYYDLLVRHRLAEREGPDAGVLPAEL